MAGPLTIFLADDNLIVREGVRALLSMEPDFEIVGVAADYDELVAGAGATAPQVVVTDIRMPPAFEREGIDAAKEVRKLHPGTGVVILSQYDDPEYAISLLAEGAAGYAYLLKDRVAEGDQLARAIREVSAGGSTIDPKIVEALVRPVSPDGELAPGDEDLLRQIAEGRPIKAIAAARKLPPEAVSQDVEKLFLKIAEGASHGQQGALRRLRMLHEAIVEREEQGETLSRFLPGGLAEKLRRDGSRSGQSDKVTVTVLMSDVRGYSTISEISDPGVLAGQLNEHRAQMNRAVLEAGGTIMQFIGDAVMAVFGAPELQPDHADRALRAAFMMHSAQSKLNEAWTPRDLPHFELGIGLSTGEVAEVLLGSEERLEYTVIGDSVNLAQRLQQLAAGGQIVLSQPTYAALTDPLAGVEDLGPVEVKGRQAKIGAYRLSTRGPNE
ncbi:MAG: adenylate cyclase [Actinomycetota bacterium]|jgi:class 3 adenylate cyclase/ActR/RegA family two-component response regulator|nr:adenylate cyclase [Actinomycetota bacterium]